MTGRCHNSTSRLVFFGCTGILLLSAWGTLFSRVAFVPVFTGDVRRVTTGYTL